MASPQLPLWPSALAGLPNPFGRSSLFAATARDEPPEFLKSVPVAALQGIAIRYTGQRLSQRDEDVFLHILARSKGVPLGQPVRFTAHALLRALGWDTNCRGYERLREALLKLKASAIECEWTVGGDRRLGYAGSLIRAFAWKDEQTDHTLREWTVWLEPKLIRLFDESSYTLVSLHARRLLGNHEVAKWLYAYLITHREGAYDMRVAKLRELCGSKAKTLFGFRRTLRQALDLLLAEGLLERYALDSKRDRVSFGAIVPLGKGPPSREATPRTAKPTAQPMPAPPRLTQSSRTAEGREDCDLQDAHTVQSRR